MREGIAAICVAAAGAWTSAGVDDRALAATLSYSLFGAVTATERSDSAAPDLAGTTGAGSFAYDDGLLTGLGNEVVGGRDLAIDLTIFGQRFTGAQDRRFDSFPALLVIDGVPAALDFGVSEFGALRTAIRDPRVIGFFTQPDTRLEQLGPATFGAAITATSVAPVPLPAGLPLLAAALGALGALGLRRRRPAA